MPMHKNVDQDSYITARRKKRILEVLGRRQRDIVLIINNIHDPHNVSAILRSCDAFGIQEVHFLYTSEPFPALGKKSSASAKKWVDVFRHTSAADMVEKLKARGFTILCTGFGAGARSLTRVDFISPAAVVLGNEHRGVDEELIRLSDGEIYIPMQGMVQSFNVSVAAALILYEAWRQREAGGTIARSGFSKAEIEKYYQEWIRK